MNRGLAVTKRSLTHKPGRHALWLLALAPVGAWLASCASTSPGPPAPPLDELPTRAASAAAASSCSAAHASASAAPAAAASPCAAAAEERKQATMHFKAGRLNRALRLVRQAQARCPAQQAEAWPIELRVLAELGLSKELDALAGRVETSANASSEVRTALAQSRARLAELASSGDSSDPRKLITTGLRALERGESARAQRLLDRGLLQAEQQAGDKARLDLAFPLAAPGPIAWHQQRLAVGNGNVVSILAVPALAEELRVLGHSREVRALALSTDGSMLASGADQEPIRLWDASSGRALRELQASSGTGLRKLPSCATGRPWPRGSSRGPSPFVSGACPLAGGSAGLPRA